MSDSHTDATDGGWLSPSAALNGLELEEHELAHGADARLGVTEHEPLRHGVTIGPYNFLLPANDVSEVIKGSTIYPIPKTADWVKGLLNLRGNLVPVFDLAERFNAAAAPPVSPQILAVGRADQALALMVDGIPKPASTSEPLADTDLPIPDGIRDHVFGAYVDDQNTWLEIDFSGLIESLTDQMEE